MADRQTMNVSLPTAQEDFIQAQVGSGRYRTASEVVREGLRLLEAQEHARLLEKALYGDLTSDEAGVVPPELLARAHDHIRTLVRQGLEDRDAGCVGDGEAAMHRIGQHLRARSKLA